jgi:fibronectin-binding autotransporter adhesin
MINKHHTRTLLGAIAALGLSAPSAFAVNYTIASSGSPLDWNTPSSWTSTGGTIPGASTTDTALVTGAFSGNKVVDISGSLSNGLASLTLGDSSGTGATTISASNGASLSFAAAGNITSAGSAGASNTISAPVTLFGGLNFVTGSTNAFSISGKITPSAAATRTIENASGQAVTLGDIDLSTGATGVVMTIRTGNNVGNSIVLNGTIANGSTSGASGLTIGSRYTVATAPNTIQINGSNTYTGVTTLGVAAAKTIYAINSDQAFGQGTGTAGKLILGGSSGALNMLQSVGTDRTITKDNVDIQRNMGAQGTLSVTVAATTIQANSVQTHTNDIVTSGKTLTLGVNSGNYYLNNNNSDLGKTTTFAGAGTTIIKSNISDTATMSADVKYPVIMNGTGTLVLTGTNAYQGGTRISSTGTVQLGNGGTTGSLSPGNSLTPVVSGTAAGTLAFNRSDAVSTSVTANGPIGIAQKGAGALTLSSSQFHSGSNVVGDGVSASTLVVNGSGVSASSTTSAATIASATGGGLIVTLAGADTVSGLNLKVGQPVTITGNATTSSYIHSISGANTFVVYGATLLPAANSQLNFGAGSALGTSAATTTVKNLSTLAGTGSIAGSVNVLSGGRLAPGANSFDADSSGRGNFGVAATLSTGALSLTSANLDFDLAATAAGTSDLLNAGSSAVSFSGLSFSFNALTAGTLEAGSSYHLIASSGSFTGDVGSISTTFVSGLSGYVPTYSVTGSGLDVTFAAVPEPASAGLLVGMATLGGFLIRRRRKTQA